MIVSEVAQRYAKAFYEIAKEKNNIQAYFSDLKIVEKALYSDQEIVTFLRSPLFTDEQKTALLKNVFQGKILNDLLFSLLFLTKRKRLSLLNEITAAFKDFVDEAEGVKRGTLYSSLPLEKEEHKKIENMISAKINKKVLLENAQDASLLGGLVVNVGGWTFDDSLKSHLRRLGEELNRREN